MIASIAQSEPQLTGQGLRIGRVEAPDGVVVRVEGDLELATVMRMRQEFERAFATAANRVVVDLRGLGFLDSTGIHALAEAHERFRAEDRSLTLLLAPGPVRRTLDVCGMLGVLDHETMEVAAA